MQNQTQDVPVLLKVWTRVHLRDELGRPYNQNMMCFSGWVYESFYFLLRISLFYPNFVQMSFLYTEKNWTKIQTKILKQLAPRARTPRETCFPFSSISQDGRKQGPQPLPGPLSAQILGGVTSGRTQTPVGITHQVALTCLSDPQNECLGLAWRSSQHRARRAEHLPPGPVPPVPV